MTHQAHYRRKGVEIFQVYRLEAVRCADVMRNGVPIDDGMVGQSRRNNHLEIVKTAPKGTEVSAFHNVLRTADIANKSLLVFYISKYWSKFPDQCISAYKDNRETFRNFMHLVMQYATEDAIRLFAMSKSFQKWCDSDSEFLIGVETVDDLSSKIDELKPIYFQIDNDEIDKSIFDLIYQKNAYRIDKKTVDCILRKKYQLSEIDYTQLCSTVLNFPEQSLCVYANQNLRDLVELSVMINDSHIADGEDVLADIVNSSQVAEDIKNSYMDLCTSKLSNIRSITDAENYQGLIEKELVFNSAHNILEYFLTAGESQVDDPLQSLIMQSNSDFSFNQIVTEDNESDVDELFRQLINIDGLYWNGYAELIEGFDRKIENIQNYSAEIDHVEVLINSRIICMNQSNYNYINSQYSDCLAEFCRVNIREYTLLFNRSFNQESKFIELLSIVKSLSMNEIDEELSDIWGYVSELDEQKKTRFILAAIERKARHDTLSILRLLERSVFVRVLTTRNRPVFATTGEEKKILDYFKSRNWVSFSKISDSKVRVIPRGVK